MKIGRGCSAMGKDGQHMVCAPVSSLRTNQHLIRLTEKAAAEKATIEKVAVAKVAAEKAAVAKAAALCLDSRGCTVHAGDRIKLNSRDASMGGNIIKDGVASPDGIQAAPASM